MAQFASVPAPPLKLLVSGSQAMSPAAAIVGSPAPAAGAMVAVSGDVAVAEPALFVAVTTTWSVRPASAATSR